MGVIKNFDYGRTPPILRSSEESLMSSVDISVPSTPPSETEEIQINYERRNPHNTPRRRDPALLLQRLELLSRKRTGARKARRESNALALQTLTENEEEITGIPKIQDFKPNSDGPFTRLFTDSNCMRVWDYFLAQNEEDQKKYLDDIKQTKKNFSSLNYGFCFMQKKGDDDCHVEGEPRESTRLPSLTPEQRFCRLNSSLRKVLKLRYMPNEILSNLENDLVKVFCEDQSAVYISKELNSYERLLVHGISQYHLLKSWSINVAGGRHTKVENRKHLFSSSTLALTDFLEKRRQLRNN